MAGGEALLSPAVTRRVLAVAARIPVTDPHRPAALTDREREVLAQVGTGRSNAEIGAAKLGARDRAQLVVIAYETGLVRPADSAP